MNTLLEIAIKAFQQGSDNFGEKPTGEAHELYYSKMLKSWHLSLILDQGTAGVGFYQEGDRLRVISGHEVFKAEITTEIQKELDNAIICEI